MKAKALLTATVVFALAFAMFVPADVDGADINYITLENGNSISMERGSTITLVLDYNVEKNYTCTISIYDSGNGKLVSEGRYSFSVGTHSLEIPFSYDKDSSQAHMKITFSNGMSYNDIFFDVSYTSSIWSNPALYGAIIVVVILIIAFVVYKSRMAPKKEKNTLTFEQIEAEKQAKKSAPAKESAPSAAKTERQRYLASKKKK